MEDIERMIATLDNIANANQELESAVIALDRIVDVMDGLPHGTASDEMLKDACLESKSDMLKLVEMTERYMSELREAIKVQASLPSPMIYIGDLEF